MEALVGVSLLSMQKHPVKSLFTMFHTHTNEMMAYIFVWISVTRLKIHMMQCPRWFNGPTCAEQQQKFTVSLTEAVTASLTALLFQRRICILVYVCVYGEGRCAAEHSSCRSATPSIPTKCTCLLLSSCLPSALLPFTARLSVTFPPRLYLFGLSVSVWVPAWVTLPLPPYRPVCTRSPDMHHTY